MKLPNPVNVLKIAELLGCRHLGNPYIEVTGINEIHKVVPGDLTFVDHDKYYKRVLESAAEVIILNKEFVAPKGKALLLSDDPFRDYNKVVKKFHVGSFSVEPISKTASIGEGTRLFSGVVVGDNVSIGSRCTIFPNVTIYPNTVIGDDVIIHANTVVGSDAFYYKKRSERKQFYDKLVTCGRVIIQNGVEIGSNCSIDNGVSGETIIGEGTKIDNLVHIGHGTIIGTNCLIAAQVGIAGKVVIGDNVTLWGQVGVSKDLVIGPNTVIMAQSGVPKSLKGNANYFGSPAMEARQKMKELAMLKQMSKNSKNWRQD